MLQCVLFPLSYYKMTGMRLSAGGNLVHLTSVIDTRKTHMIISNGALLHTSHMAVSWPPDALT